MIEKASIVSLCLIIVPLFRTPMVTAIFWRECANSSRCICSGTDFKLNKLGLTDRMDTYKKMYRNCTIVHGNLELTYFDDKELEQHGENALNFLEHIEEVMGYVLIAGNKIRNLSLPNLRVIWGDHLYQPEFRYDENPTMVKGEYGLAILNNNLTNLDLSSLTVVQNGDIGLFNNPYLCYWSKTVDFKQLLGEEFHSRLKMVNNSELCVNGSICSASCKSCFGSSKKQCQIIYRDNCALQCTSGTCFNTTYPQYCCHPECTGGCFGPSDHECYGCSNMRYKDKCVEKCPSLERYVPSKAQYEPNPDGTYSYNRICVKQCPEHMSIYKEGCVSRCPENYYTANDSKICVKCNGNCEKVCMVNDTLTAANVRLFVNCTKVEGFLEITKQSFLDGNLTEKNLSLLSSVEEISEYVLIQSPGHMSHGLDFLRNLRKIEGRRLLFGSFGLVVSNSELRYLGLVNLKHIANGEIYIGDNHDMCFLEKIPFDKISRKTVLNRNRSIKTCEQEEKICDPLCDPKSGCWGPGPQNCFQCLRYKKGGICLEKCDMEKGLFDAGNWTCAQCHQECITCNQSTPRDCLKCRHVKQDGECVTRCDPLTRYLNATTKVCMPCHTNCFSFGCTGPGNFVGSGGCNKCKYGIVEEDDLNISVTECLLSISQEKCHNVTGSENYYWNAPTAVGNLVEHGICSKCHPYCRLCTQYGRDVQNHGCVCRHVMVHRRFTDLKECDIACPQNYYNVTPSTSNLTECYPCHTECDEGCTGESPTQCFKCKSFEVVRGNETECVSICPRNKPYLNGKICSDVEMENLVHSNARKRSQKIIIIICGAVTLLLIILIVVSWVSCRRAQMLEKLAMPDDQYEMNLAARPDMSKLTVISENDLKIGDVLGFGAFGTVHKGIWFVENTHTKRKVPVAIKLLNDINPAAQQEMLEEAGNMARLTHVYLVPLIGVSMGKQMMMITPLMPLGNLLDYVKNHRNKIGSSALLRWCKQIAAGMAHLEDARVVHRDLAARNVLVQNPYHVRITDFGLAKILDYGQQELLGAEGKMPVKWLAIECIKELRFTHKSDVWAYGVTIWELFTFGDKPYRDVPMQQILQVLEQGERLPQPKICTLDVYMVMIKCWMADADSRPSFLELEETFIRMSKDPGRYLVIEGDKLLRLPSYSPQERQDLMRALINEQDLCNPEEYLDGHRVPSLPSAPTTPTQTTYDAVHAIQNGYSGILRSQSSSIGSRRYASDPLAATDVENYLVPDSQKNYRNNGQQHLPNIVENNEPSCSYKLDDGSPAGPKYVTIVRNAESFIENANDSSDNHLYYNELRKSSCSSPLLGVTNHDFDLTVQSEIKDGVTNLEYLFPRLSKNDEQHKNSKKLSENNKPKNYKQLLGEKFTLSFDYDTETVV